MKKTLVLAGVSLALSASLASAAGVNLAWDDCGTSGTSSKTFLCDGNTGTPFTMVASFIPPAGVGEFLGISSQLDMTSVAPALPDWWKHGSTACRGTSGMAISFDFTIGPFTCADVLAGQAAGGSAYDIGFGTPNRGRLRIQCAVPFDNRGPVDSNTEYYAFKVNLLRAKSSGTGSCTGCTEPMCIVLNSVQLFQPPEAANDPDISNAANSNFVTWQSASVPGCPASTPNRKQTWGQVKGLYR
jgi:hypothetical protein